MATNPVDAVREAAGLGTDAALADLWGIGRMAIYNFRRQGWLPLDRAKDAVERYSTLRLRDLVKPEIRDAMDRA
jgi:hypothetical protein